MSWFLFALLAAVLQTSSIVTDELLLGKHFKRISELSLTAAAALAGIPLLLVFAALVDQMPSPRTFLLGIAAGWLILGAYQLYYTALRKSDASLVATLFQLVIVFNLLLGITIFREHPTTLQLTGLIAVTIAAVIISFEQREKKWKLRTDVLVLMSSASLLLSISDVVFKYAAEGSAFLTLSMAEYSSTALAGILLVFLSSKVRRELWSIRRSVRSVVGIIELNELFTLFGALAIRYALVIGPLALIQGVMGTQPFIALVLGGMLGFLGITKKKKHGQSTKELVIRIVLISLAAFGSALISGLWQKV